MRFIRWVMFLVFILSAFPAYANMGIGDTGEDVLAVQKKLKAEGYFIKDLDGRFGLEMENTVKSFQKDNNLPMTGEIDKDTHLKLMSVSLPDRFSGAGNISMVRRLVSSAMSLKGVPYVFGGSSPNGFDCSGFVQYVFRQAGLSIPRMADEQYYASAKLSTPKIGDLVFFSTYTPGVSHVGIYLGNDEFIHSSSSRGISIASLKDSYWNSCYVGAGRLIHS